MGINWHGVALFMGCDEETAKRVADTCSMPDCPNGVSPGSLCITCAQRISKEKRMSEERADEGPYRELPEEEKRDVDPLRNYLRARNPVARGGWEDPHSHVFTTEFETTLLKTLDRMEARIAQLEDELRKR